MIFEPLPAGDTVVSHFLSNRNTCKSRFITVFSTYHGASVIIRNNFDWNLSRISKLQFDANLHNCTPQVQIGIRIALQTSSLFTGDSCKHLPILREMF